MFRYILASLTLVLLSVAGAPPVDASDADTLRLANDRAEIQDLMWRYVRALDTFDAEAYASVFTEDGQFSAGGNATKGRDALRKMVADLRKGREDRAAKGETVPGLYHMITNSNIEFVDKDHARFHSYWLTIYGSTGPNSPPRVAAAGRSIDELVRVNGRWLIRNRNVTPE